MMIIWCAVSFYKNMPHNLTAPNFCGGKILLQIIFLFNSNIELFQKKVKTHGCVDAVMHYYYCITYCYFVTF